MYKSVVDIGTNSFHLLIAELPGGGKVKTIHREKVIMRLSAGGKDVLKKISDEEITRAVDVLKNFKKLSDYYNSELKAVATSAVRESENGGEFVKTIKSETGIEIDVIDGQKEASLIYLAVQNALPVKNKSVLCIDIGGGSTEVIIGDNGDARFVQSYKLGAVRLSKMFFKDFIVLHESIKACSDYIEKTLLSSGIIDFKDKYDIAVGASGTIAALASVIAEEKYDSVPKDLNGFSFSVDELKTTAKKILNLATPEERTYIKGMEKERADILPAGVLILIKLFKILAIKDLNISSYALREGYLLSLFPDNKN